MAPALGPVVTGTLTSQTRALSSPPSVENASNGGTFGCARHSALTALALVTPQRRNHTDSVGDRWPRQRLSDRLGEPEFYDMAVGDGELSRRSDSRTPQKPSSSRRFVRTVLPGICMKLSPRRHDVACMASLRDRAPDAYSLDDWRGPENVEEQTNLRESTHALDRAQRVVADVVRAELQIDLESVVHRVVNQISARVGDDVCRSLEEARKSWATEMDDLHSSSAAFEMRLEEMRQRFDEQLQANTTTSVGEEVDGPVAMERCDIYQLPQSSNVHAMESQALAIERQSRIRFDAIDARLEKHLKTVGVLNNQASHFAERLARHDADIKGIIGTFREMEMKLIEVCEKGLSNSRPIRIRQCEQEDVEMIGCRDVQVDMNAITLGSLEARVSTSEADHLVIRSEVDRQSQGLEALGNQMREITEKLAKECADVRGCVVTQNKAEAELTQLRAAVDAHALALASLPNQCKVHVLSAEMDLVIAMADLSCDLRAQLREKVDNTVFVESCGARDERVKKLAGQLRDILASSEEGLNTRQAELVRLASALESRDGRVEALAGKLQKMQADVAEEIHHSRDMLHQCVQEACGQQQAQFTEFTQFAEATQSSIHVHEELLSQHRDWMEQMSKLL